MARAVRGSMSHCSRGGWFVHVDARNGAFAHADGGAAVAGNQAAEKLEQVGIVPHGQDSFAVGILRQQCPGNRRNCAFNPSAGLISTLASYPSSVPTNCAVCRARFSGLETITSIGAFERAQHPRHQHALLLAFLDQAAFGVEKGIVANGSGIRMAHQIRGSWG